MNYAISEIKVAIERINGVTEHQVTDIKKYVQDSMCRARFWAFVLGIAIVILFITLLFK